MRHLKYTVNKTQTITDEHDCADIALIENNAKVAAEIALNLCEKSSTSHDGPAPIRSIISRKKPVITTNIKYNINTSKYKLTIYKYKLIINL